MLPQPPRRIGSRANVRPIRVGHGFGLKEVACVEAGEDVITVEER